MKFIILFSILFGASVQAQEINYNAATETIKCDIADDYDASSCLKVMGILDVYDYGFSTVYWSSTPESKELLKEFIATSGNYEGEELVTMQEKVDKAAFVAVLVEARSETELKYYILNKGKQVTPEQISSFTYMDFDLSVCHEGVGAFAKFQKAENLLLNSGSPLIEGKASSIEDIECPESEE